MFHENLKACRKAKGLTQEELALRLNVVRQTISKWEKGLSVPDADLLVRLADLLEVPVSRLLGMEAPPETPPDQVAQQLARINEQLAIKNRRAKRIWKTIAGILIGLAALTAALFALNFVAFTTYSTQVDPPQVIQPVP